jgi:cysteine desulfurase
MSIYLDNGSTTKIDPKALRAMIPFLKDEYGNASSIYKLGLNAKNAIEVARKQIANKLEVSSDEIAFTSGGTESNNFAIKSIAFSNREKGNHIITTKIEHKSVINVCKWLETQGFEITYLGVDENGYVKGLKDAITDKTILVSIVHGHNEFGAIQNLKEIKDICGDIYLHTDACQSFTKSDIKYADIVSINAHKIHGPKGVGALYIKKGVRIDEWQQGGGHENRMRSGTENVAGIVGFGKAATLDSKIEHIRELKDYFITKLEKMGRVNLSKDLPHVISVTIPKIEGEAIVGSLDMEGIYVATGSACNSNTLEPNQSLLSIGLNPIEVNSTIRITLSRFNNKKEVDKTIKVLERIVKKLRDISPL